jgi:hypothetical protein
MPAGTRRKSGDGTIGVFLVTTDVEMAAFVGRVIHGGHV